jgi:methyltransferase-like protein
MLSSHFPKEVAETLERVSPDILHLEQYMDFVRNRQFRQTLLVHKAQRPTRALAPAFMRGLLVSSAAVADVLPIDLSPSSSVTFRTGTQRADVSLPASKAALTILMEEWPQAIDVDELCALALERAAPYLETTEEEARRSTTGDLFGAVMYGMVNLHTQPPNCTNRFSDRPTAHALAIYQLRSSSQVVNAHHQVVHLDPLSAEVLTLATGERTADEIVDVLLSRVAAGQITLEEDGQPVNEPSAARALLVRRLDTVLTGLMRAAVLVQ